MGTGYCNAPEAVRQQTYCTCIRSVHGTAPPPPPPQNFTHPNHHPVITHERYCTGMRRQSMAFLVCSAAAAAAFFHPNGVCEIRVDGSGAMSSFDQLETALDAALQSPSTAAIVIVAQEPSGSVDDVKLLASLEPDAHIALLRQESTIHEKMRAANCPVLAVGESVVENAALGIFLAAKERLVTERTQLKMVGCRMGLLPSGLSLLALLAASSTAVDGDEGEDEDGVLGDSQRAAMAMALALGGASINAHDAAKLKLSSMFCHMSELPSLLSELRRAPSDYLEVPLSRHSETVPACHAHLFADSVVVDALERCFGPTCRDAADMLARLNAERKRVATLTNSCGCHVRERAETVAEVLEEASAALDPRRSSPSALAATFAVLRLCWRSLGAERSRPVGAAVDTSLLGAQALLANERLLTRVDFGEALRAKEMNGRPARSGPGHPAVARVRPRWEPSTLGRAALEVASEIEAGWCFE